MTDTPSTWRPRKVENLLLQAWEADRRGRGAEVTELLSAAARRLSTSPLQRSAVLWMLTAKAADRSQFAEAQRYGHSAVAALRPSERELRSIVGIACARLGDLTVGELKHDPFHSVDGTLSEERIRQLREDALAQYTEARRLLSSTVVDAEEPTRSTLRSARMAYDLGRVKEAVHTWKWIAGVGQGKSHNDAIIDLACFHVSRGELQEALDCCQRVERCTETSELLRLTGSLLFAVERYQDASDVFDAMSRRPGFEALRDESIAWRGWSRFRAGDTAGARKDLRQALELLSVWWPPDATTLQTIRVALSVLDEAPSLRGDEVPFFDAEWGPVPQPLEAARNPGMDLTGNPWVEETHLLFEFLSRLWATAFGAGHPLLAWPLTLEGDAKTRFPGFDAARRSAAGQLERAVALIESHLGKDDEALLHPLEFLARLRADRQLGGPSVEWARRWVTIARGAQLDSVGMDRLVVLSIAVAGRDFEEGRRQSALKLTESVWRRLVKTQGEAPGDLSEVLAHMHSRCGDLDKAILFMSFAARELDERQGERRRILRSWERSRLSNLHGLSVGH